MTLFPVLVDVYHKEQLVTKEEAKNVASDEWRWQWRWGNVAATKHVSTTTRMADILDKYGFNDVARHIRGKCVYRCLCVYTVQDSFGKRTVLNHAEFMHLVLSVCVYMNH